jgi:oligopeptidase A
MDVQFRKCEGSASTTWRDEVLTYALYSNDRLLGTIHLDLFAREGKRKDIYHFPIQFRYRPGDGGHPPESLISMSLSGSSLDDCMTPLECIALFHEFGHALHQLMSEVGIADLEGVRAPRDLLEIPSTAFEYLGKCFLHATQSGKSMQQLSGEEIKQAIVGNHAELLRKADILRRARYDLLIHAASLPETQDGWDYLLLDCLRRSENLPEGEATARWDFAFHHIFAGRYAGNFYAYIVGDAVALRLFESVANGELDWPGLGQCLRDQVYSQGALISPQNVGDRTHR